MPACHGYSVRYLTASHRLFAGVDPGQADGKLQQTVKQLAKIGSAVDSDDWGAGIVDGGTHATESDGNSWTTGTDTAPR